MPGKIIIPKTEMAVLENAALVAFPYKVQARVYGVIGPGCFRVECVEFGIPMDVNALAESRTFEEYAGRCERTPHFDALRSEIERNADRFGTFRECQRRRHEKECGKDAPDSDCMQECDSYADPGILGLYDIPFGSHDGAFFAGWHAHPTSVYGPVERLAKPCDGDSMRVRQLIMSQTHIVGEMITAVSDGGEILTRAYEPPRGLRITDPLDRKEVEIEIA